MTDILKLIKDKDPGEKEFHQAVEEVVQSLMPFIEKNPKYQRCQEKYKTDDR